MSDSLTERVRRSLTDHEPREVRMFGGVSFMVADRMVVAARKNGELLLRVDPADRDDLLARPGASGAVMGAGRPMGDGWISVAASALTTDQALRAWLDVALAYHAS